MPTISKLLKDFHARHCAWFVAAALTLGLFASGCTGGKIIKVADGSEVKMLELVEELKGVRLVFVGERHDKLSDHRAQLKIIRSMNEAGIDVAVGLEMFRTGSQKGLDRWVAGEMSEDDFKKLYFENWHVPFKQYRDIFVYAKDNALPLVALNISRDIIHQVFKEGFTSLEPEQLAKLPGVKCEVDSAYEEFIRTAMGKHSHDDEATFKNFCEAQMVWDTSMAYQTVVYLRNNPDKTLVVLSGSGHSWKRGIPAQVSRQSGFDYIVVLPEAEERLTSETITTEDADYLWLHW